MKDIVNRKELKNLNVNNVNMNNMNNMNNVNMMQNASNASNVDVNTRDGKTTAWKYCKITARKGFTQAYLNKAGLCSSPQHLFHHASYNNIQNTSQVNQNLTSIQCEF